MTSRANGTGDDYTCATRLLDYQHPSISALIRNQDWMALGTSERIGAAYDFVQNQIHFGYNRADDIPASAVLRDGYGQCNTKATLLMALLRSLDIPCRLHGFTIHKSLQRGVVPELVYAIAPDDILHAWVEVELDGSWVNLEGFILDLEYLGALQVMFGNRTNSLCGYAVGTETLDSPPVTWCGRDTYIQTSGINRNLGIFNTPDEFYSAHRQRFGFIRELLYRFVIRHWMNRRVARIRRGDVPPMAAGMEQNTRTGAYLQMPQPPTSK